MNVRVTTFEAYREVAMRNDVPIGTAIEACLHGVLARGLADKFVADYTSAVQRRTRSYPRSRRSWVKQARPTEAGPSRAADWTYGPFLLTYRGATSHVRGPGSEEYGWWLLGPDLPPEGRRLGIMRRLKALDLAEAYVETWEEAEAS